MQGRHSCSTVVCVPGFPTTNGWTGPQGQGSAGAPPAARQALLLCLQATPGAGEAGGAAAADRFWFSDPRKGGTDVGRQLLFATIPAVAVFSEDSPWVPGHVCMV